MSSTPETPTTTGAAAVVTQELPAVHELEKRLGYTFGDRAIILQALTHCSFGHEVLKEKPTSLRDNERLEFLGDAVLELVLSDILLEVYSDADEGKLSKARASVVNEKSLAELAKSIGIASVVRLGKGEVLTGGGEKPSILSSTFEAIVAAIYLDGGFNAVYPVVRHLFTPMLSADSSVRVFSDHKTQLQEVIQGKWKLTPTYFLRGTLGPEHARTFEVEVKMGEKHLASGIGASKKEAEQNAARVALELVTKPGEA